MKRKYKLRVLGRLLFILVILSLFYTLGLLMADAIFWYLFYVTSTILVISLFLIIHPLFALKLIESRGLVSNEGSKVTASFQLKKIVSLAFIRGTAKISEDETCLVKLEKETNEAYSLNHETRLRRGVYKDAKLFITISDWFAIFWWQKVLPILDDIIVLPKYLPEDSQGLWQLLAEKIKLTASFNLYDQEIKNIRNYQTGDGYRQIDWKLSAKGEGLVVKEFEPELESRFKFIFIGIEKSSNEKLLALFYSFTRDFGDLISRENFFLLDNAQLIETPDDIEFAQFKRKQDFKLNLTRLKQEKYVQQHLVFFVAKPTDSVVSALKYLLNENKVTLIYFIENQVFVDELGDFTGVGGFNED